MVTDQAELREQSLKCAQRRTWLGRGVSLCSAQEPRAPKSLYRERKK